MSYSERKILETLFLGVIVDPEKMIKPLLENMTQSCFIQKILIKVFLIFKEFDINLEYTINEHFYEKQQKMQPS